MAILLNFIYSLITILIIIYIYIKFQLRYWHNRGVICIEPCFFFGNMSGQFFLDIKKSYQKLKTLKPFYGFYLLIRPALVITDLDLVKTILIKEFDSFHDRGTYHNVKDDPLSGHLLNLNGTKWKNIRSKLTPTFSSGKMKFMCETVVDLGYRLNDTIHNFFITNEKNDCIELELQDLMARFTIDVIGCCAFGIECNSLNNLNAEFYQIGREIFNTPQGSIFKRHLRRNYPKLARALHIRLNQKHHIEFFEKVVQHTIEYRETNQIRRRDFMDLLIELKNSPDSPIHFADILANVFVFFAAGYETSSSLMTFTLYEIAQNPIIQERCRTEVQNVLKKFNGKLNYDALNEMTYLDQVINESLRLHSPVPVIQRVAKRDFLVPNTNLIIEKGLSVILPLHQIHLDPDYYQNPLIFNPDNFKPEAVTARHPMAFLPFGDGPRNCIGLRFGKMESKIGLALLIQNYHFENSKNTQIPIDINWNSFIVMQPKSLRLNVRRV